MVGAIIHKATFIVHAMMDTGAIFVRLTLMNVWLNHVLMVAPALTGLVALVTTPAIVLEKDTRERTVVKTSTSVWRTQPFVETSACAVMKLALQDVSVGQTMWEKAVSITTHVTLVCAAMEGPALCKKLTINTPLTVPAPVALLGSGVK